MAWGCEARARVVRRIGVRAPLGSSVQCSVLSLSVFRPGARRCSVYIGGASAGRGVGCAREGTEGGNRPVVHGQGLADALAAETNKRIEKKSILCSKKK